MAAVPDASVVPLLELRDVDAAYGPFRAIFGVSFQPRAKEIKGEAVMIWGRQDPHVPNEGRMRIYNALLEAGLLFSWHEFNADHAFMRDEGARYDPEAGRICIEIALGLFRRCL